MRILGISSATPTLGVGLIQDGKVLAEYSGKEAKSENLLIFIDGLLSKTGIKLKEVQGVAVTQGPGSYGGLRGGLTTAKTLCQMLNIPIVGISTLEAVAYNLIDIEGTMAVIMHACRKDFNIALFGAHQGKLKRLTEDFVGKMDKIIETLSQVRGELYVVGDTPAIYAQIYKINPNTKIKEAEPAHGIPRGSCVAKLGLMRIKNKEIDDYLSLVPRYSHKPVIKEFKPR